MYEQNEIPIFRRILWIVLWLIVTVVVLWVLIWLVFFRHNTPKVATSNNAKTHHSTSPTTTAPSGEGTSPASGSTPTELANTGAGNVVVPFVVAAVAGSTIYYVRLRKKLAA